ncbi:MAG: hypothetical protein KC496_00140 [Anaerolineae bacterium]|nr:hypothetical protein [Anaerolineae bacterium]
MKKPFLAQMMLLFALLTALPTFAQDCPVSVLQAFARAGAACTDVERDQACYGNGTVSATFDAMSSETFALPGERAGVGLMQQLIVGGEEAAAYSIAQMQLQASIVSTQPGRNLLVLAYGDATLTNLVPVRPTVRVTSTGTLNIRNLPSVSGGELLAELPLRTSVTATGITAEGDWLRVEVPNTSEIGWVSRAVFAATENFTSLNIVDETTPFLRPFQVMTIVTGREDAPCEGAPESGVILQAPNNEDTVDLTVNGISLAIAGTVFVQAAPDAEMRLSVLDGYLITRAGTEPQYAVAGSQLLIPLDAGLSLAGAMSPAEPYTLANLTALPINSLNYRVQIAAPITPEALQAQIAALTAEPTPIPETEAQTVSQRCIRTAASRVTLYAGPGTFYEVIREVRGGSRIFPVLRLTDSGGTTWWQLSEGHWMLASGGRSEGECTDIPVTDVVQPPSYNVLSLERCEALNGPVRAGQYVEIQFVDGGWETIGEALQAPRIDPGRITVNEQWLWVYASDPVLISSPERYYRTFGAGWIAQPGTYRIVGSRLSYTVICDITVPLG